MKDHSLYILVLDEVLRLELSNLSRQLEMKQWIDDDHQVIVDMSKTCGSEERKSTRKKIKNSTPKKQKLTWKQH